MLIRDFNFLEIPFISGRPQFEVDDVIVAASVVAGFVEITGDVRGTEGLDPTIELVGDSGIFLRQISPELKNYRINPILSIQSCTELEELLYVLECYLRILI